MQFEKRAEVAELESRLGKCRLMCILDLPKTISVKICSEFSIAKFSEKKQTSHFQVSKNNPMPNLKNV